MFCKNKNIAITIKNTKYFIWNVNSYTLQSISNKFSCPKNIVNNNQLITNNININFDMKSDLLNFDTILFAHNIEEHDITSYHEHQYTRTHICKINSF